ncbi:nucleotidyl transferase AbiEii/AbiGii toxin family protein [Prevotella sp.]|uniref:nucleotidyl transferase AbiEii/AbiGii toxin family protein n=1 Tax=Prevotella sp. TaxID=59823 RepID=UPI002A802680|nr:nucleotidyl transferase AbiEii/AbiGii toxin family protein [Prevotella sp.]
MRLVGGTALALQYGHRQSVDLDFFGKWNASAEEIDEALGKIGNYTIFNHTENIRTYEVNGVKVDFVNYKYDWIDDMVEEGGIRLASPKDIAAMKVNAIEGRGSRKDFIDMFFLLEHYSLSEIIGFYREKYPEYSVFRALMSLTYFTDAENQIMPKMLLPFEWEGLKNRIVSEINNYSK